MTNDMSGMTWTSVGAELFDRHRAAAAGKNYARSRLDVTAAISRLSWRERNDARDMPAMAGQAFAYAINYLGLPGVELLAWNGSIEVEDPRDHTAGAYALYGIEAHYDDGRARIYLVDRGTDLLVIGSEFTPNPVASHQRTA